MIEHEYLITDLHSGERRQVWCQSMDIGERAGRAVNAAAEKAREHGLPLVLTIHATGRSRTRVGARRVEAGT